MKGSERLSRFLSEFLSRLQKAGKRIHPVSHALRARLLQGARGGREHLRHKILSPLAQRTASMRRTLARAAASVRAGSVRRGRQSLAWMRARTRRMRKWWRRTEPVLRERGGQYALLLRLDRPVGSMLLLWPTLWALWIAAQGVPDITILCVFVLGVFLMRSVGVALNDIADRDIDRHVQRTKDRPITSGKVSPLEALGVACVLLLVAFSLLFLLNNLTRMLALAALFLAATYPFMKRYTHLAQFYLGLSFASGIPMAFAAQTGEVPGTAWILMIVNVFWVVYYDTLYAFMDRKYDMSLGLKSTAILCKGVERMFLLLMLGLLGFSWLLVARRLDFGMWFYLPLLIAFGINIWQLWIVRQLYYKQCMRAFRSNNAWGAVVFAGIALHYSLGSA